RSRSQRMSALASDLTDKVVTQVARLVSIGQLPSARADCLRKRIPCWTIGWLAWPEAARLITTNAVSGVASRYPPLSGCMSRAVSSVRVRSEDRITRNRGLRVGAL